jgi:hypothetical protein
MLLFMAFAMVVAVPAVALAAELLTAEVQGAPNRVTVEQGKNASFNINLSASGNLSNAITKDNPATAKVITSYSITKTSAANSDSTKRVVSGGTGTFSAAQNFWSAGDSNNNSTATWAGAPNALGVPASISVASDVPVGTYTTALSPDNSTVQITNPAVGGASLEDKTATTLTFEVVAPPPPSDTTAPVITPHIQGSLGDNGWYTSDVSVDWTVADNESNISSQSGCDAFSVTSDQQATTYTCTATSAGGTNSQSVTIKRDGTAPVIKDDGPASQPNAAGWYNTNVTNNFSASDALSGLANATTDASFTKTTTGEGRALTVSSGAVADAAGNVAASIDSRGFDVDKTAPTLNPSVSPNPVLLNGNATATAGAQDNLSGVASEGCDPVNTSSVGAKSVSCSATDEAGNQRSAIASYDVNYRFAGFRAPVDNGGIFNSVKAGQSVPMKFSLSGNQGLSIIETGFPKVAAVACPNSATMVDQIEETTTANSGLTYDATADQYNYVWKTQSAYAGKCFRFDMKLIDGTTQSALFKFTK